MAVGRSFVRFVVEGETYTFHGRGLSFVPRIVIPFLKIHYFFLGPWITLSLPSSALGQQPFVVTAVVVVVGSAGMLSRNRAAILAASASLLLLIIWGKIADDIYGLTEPDSALLLLQFMIVIFFLEASTTALTFDSTIKRLEGKDDETSASTRLRVMEWARIQLFNLVKLTTAAFVLSLGLLVFGSIVSVSVNQIAFSGILVLASVVAIFILLTYGREPEEPSRSKS